MNLDLPGFKGVNPERKPIQSANLAAV